MTTSGTTRIDATTYAVINRALRMVGAYAATSQPRPEQVQQALEVLNMMLKSWQTLDNLWLKTYCTLFLDKGRTSYALAGATVNGFAHCATSHLQTALAVSGTAGDALVIVSDATGISDGDFIGIANDSGVIEWFYLSISEDIASLFSDAALTTPAALSADCALGNVVYSHTVASQVQRPTRVFLASRKLNATNPADGSEIPLTLFSRQEYQQLPNKTVTSKPVQAYYDPQTLAGKLYIWPTADDPAEKIVLTIDRPIDIQVSDLDSYDLPEEWLEAITFGLAERLWFEYPTTAGDYQLLASRYASIIESIKSYDREPVSSCMSYSPY